MTSISWITGWVSTSSFTVEYVEEGMETEFNCKA